MNLDKLRMSCETCGGWHYLKELTPFEGTNDISYYCPIPSDKLKVNRLFETKA